MSEGDRELGLAKAATPSMVASRTIAYAWQVTADEVQTEIFKRMTPGERWAAAQNLYWSARRLKAAWLRSLHPEWTETEVQAAVKEAFMHVRG